MPVIALMSLADWAPEMLSTHRGDRPTYTASVDWWSLGCLLYEMVQGKCPFRTKAAKKFLPDADEVCAFPLLWQ